MSDDRGDRPDRERLERDFFPEAEEILDGLGAGIRDLETALASGRASPEPIDALFRLAHSLKGLAGMAGLQPLSELTHDLEDLLDGLRLGRIGLGPAAIGLMQEAVDALFRMARELADTSATGLDMTPLRDRLRALESLPPPPAAPLMMLEPGLRAALTEYEEHRLLESARAGRSIFLVRLRLDPQGFDRELPRVLGILGGRGEVISTGPAAGAGDGMRFVLLVASGEPAAGLAESLRGFTVEVVAVRVTEGQAEAAGATAADAQELQGFSTSLRVPVARLDEVLVQVGDLSIALAALEGAAARARDSHPGDREVREIDRQVRALVPRLRALQRGTIGTRLAPLERIFGRLGPMVGRMAREAGKEVDLHALGGETEIDKTLMDGLASPLVQLLRNALAHGIEPPEERERAGKPRRGRLVLSAFRKANSVVIDVIDDGRGVSTAAVRDAAVAAGLVAPGAALSDAGAWEMIFAPGFSTAGQVDQVAGRGVGLDLVRRSIRRLKGTIEARSTAGRGATFTLTLPVTLALVQALIVRACGQRFAIPVASVRENLRVEASRLRREGRRELYDHPLGSLPLVRLEALIPGAPAAPPGSQRFAVVAGPPGRPVGILIDGFVGQQEVVIKPVGRRLRDLPGLAGATELGDATAVLVLDPEALAGEESGERAAV
jgi:two-component system chemotaxis sensor kinase CheA